MIPAQLTPEQERVLQVFQNHYATADLNNDVIPLNNVDVDQITVVDSKLFVEGKVSRKSLPHETDWVWNQTKSKVSVTLNEQESVVIAKLNPRKHSKSVGTHPSYKLWACEIQSPKTEGHVISMLWCEKGKETIWSAPPLVRPHRRRRTTISQPPSSTTTSNDLQLSDFAFLGRFVEPHIATQFGWTDEEPFFMIDDWNDNATFSPTPPNGSGPFHRHTASW